MNGYTIPENYKTLLYPIAKDRIITFWDDSSGDSVEISIKISEGEEGFYSEEYKPVCEIYKKKVDITCGIKNRSENTVNWKIYEVKKSLLGDDTIDDVFLQFEAGYYYLQSTVLDDFIHSSGNLGVFTSKYRDASLKKRITACENRIESLRSGDDLPLGLRKSKSDINVIHQHIKNMNSLLCRKYYHPVFKKLIPIDIRMMTTINGNNKGFLEIGKSEC